MLNNVLSNREMAALLQRSAANRLSVTPETFDITKFALARFGLAPAGQGEEIYQTVARLTDAELESFRRLFNIKTPNIQEQDIIR